MPGRAASGSGGELRRDAGGQILDGAQAHPLAVVADRQPDLEGVAGAVGRALDRGADDDLLVRELARRR